jgi:hypothetical protein
MLVCGWTKELGRSNAVSDAWMDSRSGLDMGLVDSLDDGKAPRRLQEQRACM